MREITDSVLLEELNRKEVIDPSILTQLEGENIEVPKPEDKGFLGETISNIPSSALEYGKGLITPLFHPGPTISGIGNILKGIDVKLRRLEGQQIEADEEKFEPYAEAAGDFFKERYGGWENIKKTISEDPVGFMGDLSTFLMGTGTVIPKVGAIGKAIEPLSIAGKGIGLVAKPVKGAITGITGITTGRGKGSIEEAMKGTETFRKAMRGTISGEEIVGEAKGGLHAIAKERGNIYRGRLKEIENMPNPPTMDINPINTRFQSLLDDFGIKVKANGDLDFGRSTLKGDPKAIGEVSSIKDILSDWGIQTGDLSPIGFDTLKRQLDNFYSETSHGRKIVADLRGKVKDELVSKVPAYAEMTKDYEKTTKVIQEIESALSLKNKSSIDTAFRKLNSAIREDDAFRRSLIDMVEKGSGTDISAMVAGRGMAGYMPTSWMGRSFSIGAFFSSLLGKPEIAPIMAMASPRIMGEFFNLLGRGAKVGEKIKSTGIVSAPVRQTLFQTGRGQQIGLMP